MMKIFQPFLQHSISLKRKTSFFCIASILLISIGTVQGQAIGKPFGNTLNFFDTNNSGGLLGHLEGGTFGVFSSGNQWIGIGQPFTMINGSTKVPAYGFRSQWEGQAGIFALTGSGNVKDLTVQWGANPNSKVRFNYASDLMNPSAVTEVLTLLPNGNVGIGRSNPSEALDINGSMALNGSIIGSGLQIDLNAGTNPKRITSNQLGGNSSMELQTFNDDIDELQTRILLRGTSGDIEFYDRTSELLAVFDGESGNVGIDTDSPSEKLDVNGNMALSGDIIGSTFQLDLSAGTNPKRITSNQLGGASTMELQTFNDDIEELQTRILLRGGGSSDIEFYDETSELFVKFDGESKRVGIGTSSPSVISAIRLSAMTTVVNLFGSKSLVERAVLMGPTVSRSWVMSFLSRAKIRVRFCDTTPVMEVHLERSPMELGAQQSCLTREMDFLSGVLLEQKSRNLKATAQHWATSLQGDHLMGLPHSCSAIRATCMWVTSMVAK
ncbi:MAG: hypothetical protein AAGA66_05250 [Bacteroidota bacterium]